MEPGSVIGISGFGVVHGFPVHLIAAVRDRGARDLVVVCNSLGREPTHPVTLVSSGHPIDRQVGDQIRQLHPDIGNYARADRVFLGRAVRYLAREAGIRQFLDIGTGLPTADNTHQVAQSIAPDSRIVYVDNDPLVLVHARALLTSTPKVPATTSTPTCAIRAGFSPKPHGRWISRSR